MSNQIIWQPQNLYQPGYNFEILLNPEFARQMYESELTRENYQEMQDLPKKLLGFEKPEPYIFRGNTCLVSQINLDAGAGRWLNLEATPDTKPKFDKSVKYSTHNFDTACSSDVLTLMSLFDLWVEYSELIRES